MTDQTPHSSLTQRYSLSLGITLALHAAIFFLVGGPSLLNNQFSKRSSRRKPIQVVSVGEKNSNPPNYVYDTSKHTKTNLVSGAHKNQRQGKNLTFDDLKLDVEKIKPQKIAQSPTPNMRPGTLPVAETAIKGIKFENGELKKMAREAMGGASEMLAGDRISLKYEVPNGKSLDELNEAELRLYGFLRRGAKNYTTSIMAELHDFELKYPHLHFPLTDTKQVMTGRLTYDEKGNLKQIKMVRWTNVDKLQGFFENVLKRMEIMQNPPKELWAENGEFTVFITLQING